MNTAIMSTRIRGKVDKIFSWEGGIFSLTLKDKEDVYWFNNEQELYTFLHLLNKKKDSN